MICMYAVCTVAMLACIGCLSLVTLPFRDLYVFLFCFVLSRINTKEEDTECQHTFAENLFRCLQKVVKLMSSFSNSYLYSFDN